MMDIYGLTDIGLVRKNNQDSYAIRIFDDHSAVAVVCDGMGGANAGNVASAVSVEAFAAAAEAAFREGIPADAGERELVMHALAHHANAQVHRLSLDNPEYDGMGTTLVGFLVLEGTVYVVNVGDSRCYCCSEGKLEQISVDHSLVQALVDRGQITPEEARTHPQKNVITRAVGTDRKVASDVFSITPKTGDRLLLCSDGLTNMVPDQVICEELSRDGTPEDAARRLLTLAYEAGATDNVTIVVAQL